MDDIDTAYLMYNESVVYFHVSLQHFIFLCSYTVASNVPTFNLRFDALLTQSPLFIEIHKQNNDTK